MNYTEYKQIKTCVENVLNEYIGKSNDRDLTNRIKNKILESVVKNFTDDVLIHFSVDVIKNVYGNYHIRIEGWEIYSGTVNAFVDKFFLIVSDNKFLKVEK